MFLKSFTHTIYKQQMCFSKHKIKKNLKY